jgi:hypothetical protein
MIRFAEDEAAEADFDLLSTVNSIFKDGGILEQVLGFEHRPEQYEMAKSICCFPFKRESFVI